MTLGAGIIGYGMVGRVHATALAACEGVELRAVSSRSPIADATFDVLQAPEALLDRADIDVVAVCTPNGTHAPFASAAIRAGKHVLVEKPFALDVVSGLTVARLAAGRGTLLSVVSQRRFEPAVQSLKAQVDSGEAGRCLAATVELIWHRDQAYYDDRPWRGTTDMDGGVLMNQGVHYIDLLRWLVGPVTRVSGDGATLRHRIDAVDTAVGILRFEGGALATVTATTAAPTGRPAALTIVFEQGIVTIADGAVLEWGLPRGPELPEVPQLASGANDPTAIGAQGHLAQWRDVVDAIKSGREPAVTASDALRTVAIIEALHKSMASAASVAPALQA